ncbi:unnamed protein product [Nippostrongylus brasiliensis]|uniref:DUF223 domain-containing protein n=1 Tax=Nippostrongylus brasiliensis TaxID=27835 RepID=A0A0N4XGA3_NIPBR|nr:unnamed protein product [Nippostrongylus brasiliensis]
MATATDRHVEMCDLVIVDGEISDEMSGFSPVWSYFIRKKFSLNVESLLVVQYLNDRMELAYYRNVANNIKTINFTAVVNRWPDGDDPYPSASNLASELCCCEVFPLYSNLNVTRRAFK